jgi:tetratricopeptide (TPR) repeat protein
VKLLPVTERLIATHPDSPTAFQGHVDALIENGRISDAAQLANQRLERLPRDPDAMRALSECASRSRDYAAAQTHALKIVDDLNPTRNDYTAAAWLALFTGKFVERAIEHAQHASKDDSERKDQARSLNTLAALYAESGKSLEARDALLQSMDAAGHAEPKSDEWYILGRIAENYGVNDVALAAHKRVDKETAEANVWLLTEKRLGMLGKK